MFDPSSLHACTNAAALTREMWGAVNFRGLEVGLEGKEEVGNKVDQAMAMGVVAIGKAGSVVLKVILPNTQSIVGL